MERLAFISLFLGLVSGRQPVDLRAGAAVKSIVLTLGGREAAALHEPPWHAVVDFGADLVPRELVAVGYDGEGREVGRATQVVNLPRPVAELEILLHAAAGSERPSELQLTWRHREGAQASRTSASLDGVKLRLSKDHRAQLPPFEGRKPHVISAEVQFADRSVARRELVLSAGYSAAVSSEVTPVLLKVKGEREPKSEQGCFTISGEPVDAHELQSGRALVIVVKDPDEVPTVGGEPPKRALSLLAERALRVAYPLEPGTSVRIVWPVGHRVAKPGELISDLLETTANFDGAKFGMQWFLTRTFRAAPGSEPRRFTDAVAVAGLRAYASGGRRAVILLAGEHKDVSRNETAAVRRYLEALGVPLFIWTASPQAEGEDVSTADGLRKATDHLRASLASQRVAWVAAEPLGALRLRATGKCELAPVGHLEN